MPAAAKRTAKENVLLWITLATGIGVLPFAFYRYSLNQLTMAYLDTSVSVVMLSLFIYIFKTRNIRVAGKILISLAFTGVMFSIYLKGMQQIYWAFPATVAAFYIVKPLTGAILAASICLILYLLLHSQMQILHLITFFMTLIITNLFSYIFANGMANQSKQLRLLATQDPLTDAGNRRALKDKMDFVIASHQRTPGKTALLLIDLDFFKKINDQFGHNTGDRFLKELTRIIKTRIRITDSLYRFGGEEFIVIAENTDITAANILSEVLRTTIESSEILPKITVTISIGVATLKDDETDEQWIKRADDALFEAKENGRNLVCVAN